MSEIKLYIYDIIRETMADGEGLRTSIYCSGCQHHCKGCHNPETWNMFNGRSMSVDDLYNIIAQDRYANVTFSGGDPLYQVVGFTELAKKIKENTDKTIWCYTGYTLDQIAGSEILSQILPWIDVLVDGPYIESLRDPGLKFRGSSNQNIIYLHENDN